MVFSRHAACSQSASPGKRRATPIASIYRILIWTTPKEKFCDEIDDLAGCHGRPHFSKEITVEGVVKEFQYTNPHSWLLVDVTDDDGTVTTWGFEAEGPSRIRLSGIRPVDFLPGTKLTITGHPMKDGRPGAAWTRAVREDGVEFDPWRAERGADPE